MSSRPLLTLAQWLSPGYPVGAYSYSHGLEWAVTVENVTDAPSLRAWVGCCLAGGAGRSDAILLAHAHRAGTGAPAREVAELAAALQPSAERRLETLAQGAAFARTTSSVWPDAAPPPDQIAYPVAVGRAARALGCPLDTTLLLYLQAFAANLVSAGVRLIPLGQTAGQRIVAGLAPAVEAVAAEAATAPLADLGGAVIRADIASMRHETQATRLFRS